MDPYSLALTAPQITTPEFYLPLHRPRKKQRARIILGAAAGPTLAERSTKSPKFQSKDVTSSSSSQQCPTPPCTECGKTFFSWKALFGHMRCHPERQWRGIRRPSTTPTPIPTVVDSSNFFTADEIEVAAGLLMLSNRPSGLAQEEEPSDGSNTRFECSSCKKVFGSHQALGGHRASHKNVKGCSAINRSDEIVIGDDRVRVCDSQLVQQNLGHQCNTCLKIFSSGQALGGHKRCHWEKNEEQSCNSRVDCGSGLDLNSAPASMEEELSFPCDVDLDLRLGF